MWRCVFPLVIQFMLLVTNGHCQYPVFRQITTDEGLPSDEVYSILEDNQGVIWIGCDAGLVRYNGFNFKHYTAQNQRSKSVTGLRQSASNRIYCYNFQGQIFYLENDSLHELAHSLPKIINIESAISEPFVYVCHEAGFSVYDEQQDKWVEAGDFSKRNPSDFSLVTRSAALSPDGKVWFTTKHGLCYWFKEEKTCFDYSNAQVFKSGVNLCEYYQGAIWVVDMDGQRVLKYHNGVLSEAENEKIKKLRSVRKITRIKSMPDGKLWFFTYSGIISFDSATNEVNLFYPGKAFSDGLIDHEGNYWFTTVHNGIIFIPNFSSLVWKDPSVVSGEPHYTLFVKSDSMLWTSGLGGVISGITPHYKFHFIETGMQANINSMGWIKGNLYFNVNNRLYKYANEEIIELTSGLGSTKRMVSVGNELIFATSFGAEVRPLSNLLAPPKLLNGVWTREIIADTKHNTLWLATHEGLSRFVRVNMEWNLKKTYFTGIQVLSICLNEAKNVIYALTFDGRVSSLDAKGNEEVLPPLPQGSHPSKIRNLNGLLYVTSNKGLWLFDATTQRWEVTNKLRGLESNYVHDVIDFNGYIWLATAKGLHRIEPGIPRKATPAVVRLKRVSVDGSIWSNTNEIEMNPNSNLMVETEVIHYASNGILKLLWRLNDADEWNELSPNPGILVIPSLPTGSFKLEIKAIDAFGEESENVIVLNGAVAPYFWQHWWFSLLAIVFMAALGWTFIRYRIRLLRKGQMREIHKLRLEHELKMMQQTALKAQMDPHFIFNVLTSIKAFIYANDKENADNYLTDFADLIRQILETSSKSHHSLTAEVKLLQSYIRLETMLLSENVAAKVNIDSKLNPDSIEIPGLLIQPFVENAFKHGLRYSKVAKSLEVFIGVQSKDCLKVIITDNGIGREASRKRNLQSAIRHESFAESATQKRIALLNGPNNDLVGLEFEDLLDEFGKPQGTRVIIRIRTQKPIYAEN